MATRAAGFIIYRKVNESLEYLLLQTSYGENHWTPPKGHVDPGESDLETAYRETMEEAGLLKEHLKLHEDCKIELNYLVNEKPKLVIYWLAKLVNIDAKVVLSEEHQDFRWLDLQQAKHYSNYVDMQKALQKCQEYLQGK